MKDWFLLFVYLISMCVLIFIALTVKGPTW